MTNIAISAKNIGKCYKVFSDQHSRLLHSIYPKRTQGVQEIWALKDINFEIKRGESVAIIGRNGGGKSTLLEILAGTLTPSTGSIKVNGRVCALLELGSGFNPEYSGRDNVIINGLLLGLQRSEIVRRFHEIESFAEIGVAIDRPVKTYSSGMLMRLAFAVQVITDPEILIIDEALSVGDFFFQQKCIARIREMQKRGVTILFVSHDMGMVRNVCSRAINLKAGEVVFIGDSDRAVQIYFQEESGGLEESKETTAETKSIYFNSFNSHLISNYLWKLEKNQDDFEGKTCILGVDFQDSFDRQTCAYAIGEFVKVLVLIENISINQAPAITIKNALGQVVNVSYYSNKNHKNSKYTLYIFEIELALEAGRYSIQAFIGEAHGGPNTGKVIDETPFLGPISINWNYEHDQAPFYGMFGLPVKVKIEFGES